jgi:prevent-host-death family protein
LGLKLVSGDHKSYDVVMNVPIREFKARLSRYLRAASAGKDVVVTSRGKPVARIVPLATAKRDSQSLSREELVERIKALMPEVRIGTGKAPRGSARPIKIKPGQKTMAEIIAEGRR